MTMLRSVYPIYNNGQGISYICRSLCEHLGDSSLAVEAWFPSSDDRARRPFVHDAYPRWLMPLMFRLPNAGTRLANGVERAFVKALRPGDIAYLWPGVSLETYQRIKDLGITIVAERINCHTQLAKRVLDREYERIGWKGSHGITEQDVEGEIKELALADFIYAPNPFVVGSLLESGVPEQKILPVSYGWEPERMQGTGRLLEKEEGLTVLFVGRLCIRKGVQLLLEAWKRAGVKGRLLFAGEIAPDVAGQLAESLARPDIVLLGHTMDIGSVYRSADVFVFDSLEEGGPMVTYEAMGCGLPVIVSPMGAGPARDGIDGFVLDPHDIDAWVSALRRMANDGALRMQMGNAARERAQEFTWEKVAARRRELLFAALDKKMPTDVNLQETRP